MEYNPKSGRLIWKIPSSYKTKSGTIAGCYSKGYIQIGFGHKKYGSRTVRAHHIAWYLYHGEWPKVEIDHKNLNRADNRIKNLRLAGDSKNEYNRTLRKDNTSGYKGVYWQAGKWRVEIHARGKKIRLGCFNTALAAAKAYDKAAIKLHGKFARPNSGMK